MELNSGDTMRSYSFQIGPVSYAAPRKRAAGLDAAPVKWAAMVLAASAISVGSVLIVPHLARLLSQ